MALRFQHDDDVDGEVKGGPSLGCALLVAFGIAAFFLASYALQAFFSGKSLSVYRKDALEDIVVCFVLAVVFGLIVPKYEEFRLRAKETYGKLSEIGEAVNGDRAELLERLTRIEEKLDSMQRKLESHIESTQ